MTYGKYSIKDHCAKLWNDIDEEMKEISINIDNVPDDVLDIKKVRAETIVGKDPPVLVTGMPLVMYCSHSFYSHKNARGEIQKEYYPLALLPMENIPKAIVKKKSMLTCMKPRGLIGYHLLPTEMTLHECGYNFQKQECIMTNKQDI